MHRRIPITNLYLPILLAILVFASCKTSRNAGESAQSKSPVPVDSLLGDVYHIPNTDQRFRPPVGFAAAPDTVLQMLRAQLAQNLGDQKGVEMVQCYLDTIHTAGLTVSTMAGINLGVDTTGFLERYRQKLYDIFGQSNISEDNIQSGRLVIKRLFVADSIIIRVHLICLSQEGNASEITYFTPRDQYPQLLQSIESSIGSIEAAR